ncbi:hypothetical protein HPB52_017673 [Rhipicephalus sanguineus]|uniref:Uncharacterized protein n=1 Tax=Rhipicephalus sanguineus TaxID=34632 RepID=A0A9D4TB37_RHISA|nr:hypothetical protein HPB52_017673 [Rhipicephalus sanguineus]
MGTDASTGIKIHRLLDGRASTFSEESPSHKESPSMSLDASRDEAEDVPYVSSEVAIEDVLPDNSDVVAKSRNKAEKLVRCELLVDKGCKDETALVTAGRSRQKHGFVSYDNNGRLRRLTSSKCNLRMRGACAEHHAAKTGRGRLLVQLRTSAGGILCHALSRASISSEQSPSLKEFSSLSLDASRVEAQDDVSCASSELSIEDALPNLDVEAKPRNKVDRLVLCDLLVDKGSQEETACHYSTSHASTPQRAQCHMAALWSAGRPQTVSTMEPSTCRLQPGMSIILQVVECGGLTSAEHNPGVLGCKPQLHLQDKLHRVFTKADMDSDTVGAEIQAAAFGGYAR